MLHTGIANMGVQQMKTPDPNAKAPRPQRESDDKERKPDMDHPPPAQGRARPVFDRGTAAADRDARSGQRPGEGDYAAIQAEGTADAPGVERAKHPVSPGDESTGGKPGKKP